MKMITSSPAILGLAFENIDEKLRYARKLRKFGVDGIRLIEQFSPLLGYSILRIKVIVRIVLSIIDGDKKIFNSLITKKVDRTLAGFLSSPHQDKKALMRSLRLITNSDHVIALHRKDKAVLAYIRYCSIANLP